MPQDPLSPPSAHEYLNGAHLVDVERHARANVEEARQLHPSERRWGRPSGYIMNSLAGHRAAGAFAKRNLLGDSRLKVGPRVVHNIARSIVERPRARPKGHKLDLAAVRPYKRLGRAEVAARADAHTNGRATRSNAKIPRGNESYRPERSLPRVLATFRNGIEDRSAPRFCTTASLTCSEAKLGAGVQPSLWCSLHTNSKCARSLFAPQGMVSASRGR